jgi:hypothetical protein
MAEYARGAPGSENGQARAVSGIGEFHLYDSANANQLVAKVDEVLPPPTSCRCWPDGRHRDRPVDGVYTRLMPG